MSRFLGFVILLCLWACQNTSYLTENQVQLSTPSLQSTSIFAASDNRLMLQASTAGVQFWIKHLETDNEFTASATEVVTMDTPGTFEIRARKNPFLQSEAIVLQLLPPAQPIEKIEWISDEKPAYFKGGAEVLIDKKNAAIRFHDKGWVGANTPFRLGVQLPQTTRIDSIVVGVLLDSASWIYPLGEVHLNFINTEGEEQAATHVLQPAFEADVVRQQFITLDVSGTTNRLELEFIPSELPPTHQGAGQPTWLFLDELIIY